MNDIYINDQIIGKINVAPKVATVVVTSKVTFIKMAQKLCCQEPLKIAQCGHKISENCHLNLRVGTKIGFFKWAIPGLFLIYFRPFKQTLQFLQQIHVEKYYVHPVYGAGIRTHNIRNTSLLQ